MKLVFEIVAIWTLLNFIIGIPVWMLVKTHDRRETLAQGPDWEDSYASESSSGLAYPAQTNSGIPSSGARNPSLPLVVAAARLVPDAGSVVLGAVSRVSTDHRSVNDV